MGIEKLDLIKKANNHISNGFEDAKSITYCGHDEELFLNKYFVAYYIVVINYGVVYQCVVFINVETNEINMEIKSM